MRRFLPGLWLIVGLELRQRVRGAAWYVLIGIFAVVLLAVTGLFTWFTVSTPGADSGGPLYSVIMYIVLLLSTLMTPALSGSAINGDRDTGTLATTQVTLITTGQLVVGKFLAAWVSALAFLVVSLPFIIVAVTLGGLSPVTIVTSALILVAELGVFAAIGVGLSGLLSRPLFSVVVSYLTIAALCAGSLISFGLLTLVTRSDVTVTQTNVSASSGDPSTTDPSQIQCDPPTTYTYPVPRYDYYWWMLASNPYVVVADATPGSFTSAGSPADLFSIIATGVRSAQHAPPLTVVDDYCAQVKAEANGNHDTTSGPTSKEVYDSSVPSWFVGLGIHILLAAGLLAGAWARTRTPARRLSKGSRIA
ncbi:ABC transporter permease [Diaminobutyricibacter sp. McL0608]|uniref:ABC transporter permease n=1 Tax=Leifsonia sp. McL0608 TaxID=3143537 RepID=UPI0031F32B44